MSFQAETIRAALRCGRPDCSCKRGTQVHCPGHADKNPSLSVEQRDGVVLVHCFAGCPQEGVIDALRERGLWAAARGPQRVRPGGILLKVAKFIEQYVTLPSQETSIALALWVAHTWALDAFEVSPYLVVTSPEKRSGKTRLLEVLELLLPRPWRVVQPSEAVLFRKITRDRPVLLLDEADAIFANGRKDQYEPLRAVLNAGFRRGALVPRCVGEGSRQELVDFGVFCPKAIAAIGELPDTIEDRAIVIRLDRASPAEQRRIRRLRFKEADSEAAPLREGLASWAETAVDALRDARPALPDQLDSRAADGWEPLLAVADQAGDGWFVVAWESALSLSTGPARSDESLRVRLLADIRRAFDGKGTDRLATTEMIGVLCEDEAAPWGDWHGRPITPQALARLLRPFGIKPGTIRLGVNTAKGYHRDAFLECWERYLAAAPSLTSMSVTSSHPLMDADLPEHRDGAVPDQESEKNLIEAARDDVTDESADLEEGGMNESESVPAWYCSDLGSSVPVDDGRRQAGWQVGKALDFPPVPYKPGHTLGWGGCLARIPH